MAVNRLTRQIRKRGLAAHKGGAGQGGRGLGSSGSSESTPQGGHGAKQGRRHGGLGFLYAKGFNWKLDKSRMDACWLLYRCEVGVCGTEPKLGRRSVEARSKLRLPLREFRHRPTSAGPGHCGCCGPWEGNVCVAFSVGCGWRGKLRRASACRAPPDRVPSVCPSRRPNRALYFPSDVCACLVSAFEFYTLDIVCCKMSYYDIDSILTESEVKKTSQPQK